MINPLLALALSQTTGPAGVQEMARSPFVTDTLNVLVGGAPAMGYAPDAAKALPRQGISAAPGMAAYYRPSEQMKLPSSSNAAQDSVNFTRVPQDPQLQRALLSHEFGHAFDARGRAPELVQSVTAQRPHKGSYAAANPREHFAEAFARAVQVMQSPISDPKIFQTLVDAVEKGTPGASRVIEYLLAHPVYAQHPLARKPAQ